MLLFRSFIPPSRQPREGHKDREMKQYEDRIRDMHNSPFKTVAIPVLNIHEGKIADQESNCRENAKSKRNPNTCDFVNHSFFLSTRCKTTSHKTNAMSLSEKPFTKSAQQLATVPAAE